MDVRLRRLSAGLLLRAAGLRDQGPAVEACGLGAQPDPDSPLEDAGGMARSQPERGLRGGAAQVVRASLAARLRRTRPLPVPLAWSRQEDRREPTDDVMARGLAVTA